MIELRISAWLLAVCLAGAATQPVRAQDATPSRVPEHIHAQGDRPRIGLVLSGGGARGAAHIGVLRVLEELRIPIDVIAGTSMGAIVGASYACGVSVAEMQASLGRLGTAQLFNDDPPRSELSMRRKADDSQPFVGPQFGIGPDGMRLPNGAVSGVSLEAVMRELVHVQGEQDFDQLPIPFRAVATDIETGRMFVFRRGEVASAIRASMSVPGLVAPHEVDGRLLVDGGLTRNLPVDVAREAGADIIIAVNLGTPLLRRDQVSSIVGVSAQMIAILTEQNVERSLAQLRTGDVLIAPDLGEFSAGDFDQMTKAVALGEAAARAAVARLSGLALTPLAYAQLRARQTGRDLPSELPIDLVRVEGTQRVDPAVVIARMRLRAGDRFDQQVLDRDLHNLYGSGDFEHVGYRVDNVAGQRILTVQVKEKSWGPAYMRFGLGLQSDFRGEASFDVYASYRNTWLNFLGGEFRADARLGRENRLAFEFNQPLDFAQHYFIAPRIELLRRPFDIYSEDVRIARFTEATRLLGLDIGTDIGHVVEVRTGLMTGARRFSLETGPTELVANDTSIGLGAWRTQVRLDTIDNLDFARSGASGSLEVLAARKALGADADYALWKAAAGNALSSGSHTVRLDFKGGGPLDGTTIPVVDQFRLGGPFELSGYRPGQWLGQSVLLARVVYLDRILEQPLLRGAFAGLSLEAGRVRDPAFGSTVPPTAYSASTFVAVDSPLGPLYVGLGFAPRGNRTAYLFLGRP